MLENTFCHIQGIGPRTEKRLWEANIHNWYSFLGWPKPSFSAATVTAASRTIAASITALAAGDASWFYNCLNAGEHWRMFKQFKHKTAYIDIETTGLDRGMSIITTIALYDGKTIFTYVNGENLERFVDDIAAYDLLVTYNGKSFDVPFIESFFDIRLPHAHIDLRYVLNSLGFKGGLKRVEKRFGISRNELEGVDGYFAVLLWMEYETRADPRARETLIAYNVEDVVNLELLMHYAYNQKIKDTPFAQDLIMAIPLRPEVPYAPDVDLVNTIRRRFFTGG